MYIVSPLEDFNKTKKDIIKMFVFSAKAKVAEDDDELKELEMWAS